MELTRATGKWGHLSKLMVLTAEWVKMSQTRKHTTIETQNEDLGKEARSFPGDYNSIVLRYT